MPCAINTSLLPPTVRRHVWTTGVGRDEILAVEGTTEDLAWRVVTVGTIAGALTLRDYAGQEFTFTQTEIEAKGGVLCGQWAAIVANNSGSYALLAER